MAKPSFVPGFVPVLLVLSVKLAADPPALPGAALQILLGFSDFVTKVYNTKKNFYCVGHIPCLKLK